MITLQFEINGDTADLPELNIGTFNVNGLGDKVNRKEVLNWIKLKQDDIVLIQEHIAY